MVNVGLFFRRIFLLGLLALAALSQSGCATYYYSPPPYPRYARRVWVPGHWRYRPRWGDWVWVPGHWVWYY
ncbi:YXWGXW repeat-containing protein [Candidatus Methylacidithermus pantelleriae]|nr:YXWGXW repeat-containing protein [Candidatus Methylacidithermus pantelleriae]